MTATVGNGRKNLPKRNSVKLGSRKQQVKHLKWQRVQKNNKRTFAELFKLLDKSSKELKATSAYPLECQVEDNCQLFKAHYRNMVKDRAEIFKNTTMLNETLAAAWRIRHEILKLKIARWPKRYHKAAWSLVRHVYFKLFGNRQLVDPIFYDLIKIAMENATFWKNNANFGTISE
jgi:hypothetical protein